MIQGSAQMLQDPKLCDKHCMRLCADDKLLHLRLIELHDDYCTCPCIDTVAQLDRHAMLQCIEVAVWTVVWGT